MKRLSLIVFLVVLMTISASAATFNFVGSAGPPDPNPAGTGQWLNAAYWNPAGVPADTGLTGDYYKVPNNTASTIDGPAGNFPFTKLTVAGTNPAGSTLNIIDGSIGTGNELQIGDAGKTGTVVQTGGTVSTLQGSTAGKIEIGYKAAGIGSYTISGGSIGFTGTSNVGQILVGGAGATGSTGTFTIHGHTATINTDRFWVGVKDAAGGYPGTGTVKFELTGNVSPINAQTSVTIDPIGTAVANLVVALTDEDVPPAIIPLIVTSSATAVLGTFYTVSGDQTPGDRAKENDQVVLLTPGGTSYTYYLSYKYNAEAGTLRNGNDIALVPEPATIALLGLGLLALVRRPRKK